MDKVKLRQKLVLLHLYFASILVPFILLVALTGSLDLIGIDAKVTSTPITLPAAATLDFKSLNIESDIRALLKEANVDIKFEYIRGRGNTAITRPTSRRFVQFQNSSEGLTASLENPNLQYRLFELHKGHGPVWFKRYQIFAGICLILVVFGGVTVGLLAKAYRKKTLISMLAGALLFIVLGFL